MLEIKLDEITGKEILALLEEHLTDRKVTFPPESKHAFDISYPEIRLINTNPYNMSSKKRLVVTKD